MINIKPVLNKSAFDTLSGIISNFFAQIVTTFTSIGGGLSTTIFVIAGITLVILALMMLWSVKNNNGTNEIWENHSGKVIAVIIVCLFAGLVSAAFFNA